MKRTSWYTEFAQWAARESGRPIAFALAIGLIVVWLLTGPIFGFSDTWQLVVNTASSIATFLMVFIIQNTQNRQTDALQIKLDELIRATRGAHNALLDLEELDAKQLENFRTQYTVLARKARAARQQGCTDTSGSETLTTWDPLVVPARRRSTSRSRAAHPAARRH